MGNTQHGDPTISLTHTSVNVTSADTAISTSKPDRRYLLIQNISTTEISIKTGAAAVLNQGIRLSKAGVAGDRIEFSPRNGNLHTDKVHGIAATTGNKVVLVSQAT